MGLLDFILGNSAQGKFVDVPPRTDYPSQADVDFARKNDATYGYPAAPHLLQGANVNIVPDTREVVQADKENRVPRTVTKPLEGSLADTLYAAWLAAQRSPVAAVGFDPSRMSISPPNSGPALTAAGQYVGGKDDNIWWDSRYGSTGVHESTHRGIEKLRDAKQTRIGVAEAGNFYPEETYVRGLMSKHFGDTEKGRGDIGDKQVEKGQALLKSHSPLFTKLEEAAAALYAQQGQKMGPR